MKKFRRRKGGEEPVDNFSCFLGGGGGSRAVDGKEMYKKAWVVVSSYYLFDFLIAAAS